MWVLLCFIALCLASETPVKLVHTLYQPAAHPFPVCMHG